MLSPGRAVRNRGQTGAKLYQPYRDLAAIGVYLRQGWTHLLAAAPGGYKSVVALNWADAFGGRALYITIDTDRVTTSARLAARRLGWTVKDVEARLDSEQVQWALAQGNVVLASEGPYRPQDIVDEVRAYVEVYGQFPEMLVVDNLIDVHGEGDTEWNVVRGVIDSLNELARGTDMATLVLAHATGKYEDGEPIPLSGLEFKPGKNVGLCLTMDRSSDEVLNVRVVKSRAGKADPKCKVFAQVHLDAARATVGDMPSTDWLVRGRQYADADAV